MGRVPKAFRTPQNPVSEGSEWDGLVSKITEFGCFVKLANTQSLGLIHVSSLAPERLEKEEVPAFIEETVGPIGSAVRVRVNSVSFKGQKRVSLQLLDVISKQTMEDIVFARPGDEPSGQQGGDPRGVDRYNDLEEDEEDEDADEEDGEEGDEPFSMEMDDDWDAEDEEDEDADEDGFIVELDEDDDADPLEALRAEGFNLMDGLEVQDVSSKE